MDRRAETQASQRVRVFARICVLWGMVILGRLVYLQILHHQEYRSAAEDQQSRKQAEVALRGAIRDRNGAVLAMSIRVDSVAVNPLRIPDTGIAAGSLARVLQLDEQELKSRFDAAKQAGRGFLWVKRRISPQEAASVRNLQWDWVEFRTESQRVYPRGSLAAHVVGSVDFEEKGNNGIEQSLDAQLRPTPGLVVATADARNRVLETTVARPAQPGADITLTLDERIQHVAERELAEAVQRSGAHTGSVVVMDPRTGEILAMANYPTYDPNRPPAPGEALSGRHNLAVSHPCEPGSVFKVFTLAAAVESIHLSPEKVYFCGLGRMVLAKRIIRDAKPNGYLSVADILAKSSNIGAIKIALDMGEARFRDYIQRFGFGQKTGIELPGESPGRVRKRWQATSIASVAMGHEITTTTLQLARACSVIANGGFLVRPHVVRGVSAEPPRPVLQPDTVMIMRRMMEGVVLHGTGRRAQLAGYTSAGKTGSAQIYDFAAGVYTHRYNASFMGFAPVTNPAVVAVVTLNGTTGGERGFGGVQAAPVFRAVVQEALRLLGVTKDVPDPPAPLLARGPQADAEPDAELDDDLAIADLGVPPGEDDAPSQEGPKAPDFRGKTLRAVLEESAALGLPIEPVGHGLARRQYPLPGTPVRPGERVRVVFAR